MLTCVSVEGFQSGSKIMTRSAPVKLTPSPPTRVVSRKMKIESSWKQQSHMTKLIPVGVAFGGITVYMYSTTIYTHLVELIDEGLPR